MAGVIAIDGSLPWQDAVVTLDGVDYVIELAWNTRDSRWYLSLKTAAGTELLMGVAVVVDYSLLSRVSWSPDAPPGVLMAIDTTGAHAEISEMEDLGSRVQLTYLSSDEVSDG